MLQDIEGTDIEGTDEVTTIPNSLGVCDEWWLFRPSPVAPRPEKAAPLDHIGNIHYQLYQAYRKLGEAELAQKALARSQDIRRSSLEHDQALIMGSAQVESDPQ